MEEVRNTDTKERSEGGQLKPARTTRDDCTLCDLVHAGPQELVAPHNKTKLGDAFLETVSDQYEAATPEQKQCLRTMYTLARTKVGLRQTNKVAHNCKAAPARRAFFK